MGFGNPVKMRAGLLAVARARANTVGTVTLDSYTRMGHDAKARAALDSRAELNGYPIVAHDIATTRAVEIYHSPGLSPAGHTRCLMFAVDYLLDKAERQTADATVEHKRQMFLKKELAWVRQGPRAQRSKQRKMLFHCGSQHLFVEQFAAMAGGY